MNGCFCPLLLCSLMMLLSGKSVAAQSDTIIDGMHYEITQRFKDGAVKQVGEFSTNCIGEKHRKHGYFISYNKQGRETSRKIYFYDHRRNKKFLGIKIGWWGFYLENDFYVLGVITKRRIIDPCF